MSAVSSASRRASSPLTSVFTVEQVAFLTRLTVFPRDFDILSAAAVAECAPYIAAQQIDDFTTRGATHLSKRTAHFRLSYLEPTLRSRLVSDPEAKHEIATARRRHREFFLRDFARDVSSDETRDFADPDYREFTRENLELAALGQIRERTGLVETQSGPPADLGLTARQWEVAQLVATGRTNYQIAHQLGISEWTAVNHVRSVMRRLGCASRVDVARAVIAAQNPGS